MYDNLRDQTSSSPYFQDDGESSFEPVAPIDTAWPSSHSSRGMTPKQRFLLAVLFLFEVLILGVMLLVVTGKIAI